MKGFGLLSTRADESGLLLAGLFGAALARGAVADDHWDDRFNLPGIAFRGRALAVAGSLTYVGALP